MNKVVIYLRLITGTTASDKDEAASVCRQILVDELAKTRIRLDSDDGGDALFSAEIIGEHVEKLP